MQKQQFLQTPMGLIKVIGINQAISEGWRVLTYGEGIELKDQLSKIISEWEIIAFETGKIDGHAYGNKISETYGPECEKRFIIKQDFQTAVGSAAPPDLSAQNSQVGSSNDFQKFIQANRHANTPLGLVVKCSLQAQIPNGFRKLTIEEGQQIKQQLTSMLDIWSIVAFETGKIDGQGYGNQILGNYGKECGEVFVVTSSAPFQNK